MQLYADLLLTGGRVYTAEPGGPRWAEAVAVRDGRILAIGKTAGLSDLRGPRTEVVELAGRLLLPGFTESHVHFIELALRASQVDVTHATSAGRGRRSRSPTRGDHAPVRHGPWHMDSRRRLE